MLLNLASLPPSHNCLSPGGWKRFCAIIFWLPLSLQFCKLMCTRVPWPWCHGCSWWRAIGIWPGSLPLILRHIPISEILTCALPKMPERWWYGPMNFCYINRWEFERVWILGEKNYNFIVQNTRKHWSFEDGSTWGAGGGFSSWF